jgi:hypothetical protein
MFAFRKTSQNDLLRDCLLGALVKDKSESQTQANNSMVGRTLRIARAQKPRLNTNNVVISPNLVFCINSSKSKMKTHLRTALLFSNTDRGAIKTTLETFGYTIIVKVPLSSVNNWWSICDVIEPDKEDNLIFIGKFTENLLFQLCSPDYKNVKDHFLNLLKKKKHLIFIYKNNLFGEFSYFSPVKESAFETDDKVDYLSYTHPRFSNWLDNHHIQEEESEYFHKVKELIKELNNNYNVLPYEKLIDIENAGQNFIEHSTEGLMFKIYVPNEQIWSNEFDKFINLFRDFASNVSKVELTVKQNRTDLGIVFSLYSQVQKMNENDINYLYREFTQFMDMCASDPEEAIKILNNKEVNEGTKQKILAKYIKEAKRLMLDLKHERELKLLSIKQKIESEFQESSLSEQMNKYVESLVPKATSTSNILQIEAPYQTQIINYSPQYIQTVNGIVAREISGTINFSPEEDEFLKLIEKYAQQTTELADLKTALYELKDRAKTNEEKRSARQKLYGFLGKVADKVGDVGVALLSKYLEQQIFGS